ncbi:MAG: trimethylamine methyltransferase family protein [Caldilineaceae bacterium]
MRPAQITYNIPRAEVATPADLQRIHDMSMRVLNELGIAFYDAEALEILAGHGARVEGDIAFFDEALVMEYVQKAPAEFTQQARNPANNIILGGNRSVFAPVYGPPFVQDKERGRRQATLEDFRNFVKLAYMSPYLHHSGGTVVEPNDEPVPTRHLDMVYTHARYSDKAFMGSVTDPANAADSVAMAEIVFGKESIRETPALLSLINVSSPRRYDDRMLGCVKVYAKARQALLITPFLMAGAMSPASLAGTMALQNAEALAGIALAQMITPGLPVIYGSFMTNLDLQSGATVFGSPESQLTLMTLAQLAASYKLPFRSGGTFTSSKLPDAQAGYESVQVMLPAVQAQTNFILHAAGWLESGLVAGYEKFVIDCEVLGMYHRWARHRLQRRGLRLRRAGRSAAGRPLFGHAAHHPPLPRRVLPRGDVRLQRLRAVGTQRRGRHVHPRQSQVAGPAGSLPRTGPGPTHRRRIAGIHAGAEASAWVWKISVKRDSVKT